MSASQDKKRRVEERGLGTERRMVAAEKEAKERKKSKIKWTVGTIIVVLLIAAILIGNSNLFYTAQTAVKVGDVKYSAADVNYYYMSIRNQFMNYGIIDSQTPLDQQACTYDSSFDTWDDYLRDAAVKQLVQVTAMCKTAGDAGMTLTEEDQNSIDEQLAELEISAKDYGYSSANK